MAAHVWRSLALLLAVVALSLAKYAELQAYRGAGRLAAREADDERRDVEMLAAVRASVHQWELKRARTRSKRSQGSVCYGDFGCFEDAGPFAYLETLPSTPKEVSTHFLLYSTTSRGDQPLLSVSASNMSAAWAWAARAFDVAKPTRVIVHGFGSNCDNVWVYEMRSALMAVEECNVVCVDWEGGATMPNYLRAAANARLVGKQLALLLSGLAEHIKLRFQDVHLIGFSLGAHVAGFAGSELGNISRITGLDPAGPLFEFQDPRARLDSGDAKFVDVIHSNGETLILGGLGAAQPLGHVDFYPNGGRVQHGCSNLFLGAVSDLVLPWAAPSPEGRSLCNHRRAYKFFTDSVSPKCHFPAFPCNNYDQFLEGRCFPCGSDRRCGNMGYYADRSLGRGQLFLLTREEEPFCAHQYHVSLWGLSGGAGAEAAGGAGAASHGRVTLTLHGDSGLNETFPMTKKEDAALAGGARLTRMLVPHPALGVPLRATLHYVAYSGWLSAGARVLTVDKLLIADSFGKTSSFCKKGLELVSDEPVDLPLYPGDCHVPQGEGHPKKNKTTPSTTHDAPSIDPVENELPEDSPPRSALNPMDLLELPWESADTGRAFGVTNRKPSAGGASEVAEPVLRPRPHKTPRHRAHDPPREISEPLLQATAGPPVTSSTPLARRAKNYEATSTAATYDLMSWGERAQQEDSGFAVQFLPTRLASFISRAERYARDTILPLVSAYAPRLPLFGARETPRPVARYIPTELDNTTASVPIPTPTIEMKIESLRSVGPPSNREEEVPVESIEVTTTPSPSSTASGAGALEPRGDATAEENPHPEPRPTALPPVAVRGGVNDSEQLLIVYPSNTRDDRKIRSHSYSEEMQFEALYRHTAEPAPHVDLPTYRPPAAPPAPLSPPADPRFIPVTYPNPPPTTAQSNSSKV